MSKILGYRGIEAADIIMYLSRIIYNLGYKVLICDYSQAEEMEYYIPAHTNINPEQEYVDYRGVDFSKQMLTETAKKEYDVIFINFGFAKARNEMEQCQRMIYVTDMNKAHLKKLLQMEDGCNEKHLIIRDMIRGSIGLKAYEEEIIKSLGIAASSKIRYSKKDIKISTLMQYNDKFRFYNISSDLYHYLTVTIEKLFADDIPLKRINKAIHLAMRGK